MKKSIVFGANGYIGRHLVYYLSQQNHEVVASDISLESLDKENNYISVDVTNIQQISAIDFDVDYIYCFGGLTGTNIGFEKYNDFIAVNEIGLLNILTHHKNSNSKARIIFPSSRLVYKGKKNVLLKEEDEKEALTIYAQNKLSGEKYLEQYAQNFGIEYTIFRICVPYGNVFNQSFSYGTVGFFYNKVKNKQPITLFGDGDLKRTFTHVEDICQAIMTAINHPYSKNNSFNIGSTDHLSLLEVAQLFATKWDVPIKFEEWTKSALLVESGDTIFDDKKLIDLTDFKYKNSIKNWIEKIII